MDAINNNLIGKVAGGTIAPGKSGATPAAGAASFSDMLRNSIEEVSRLQQDASAAVENLATGKTDNVTGVMSAVEKSDLAFKTLLSIRSKLVEAYEEIKGMSI
jgi:flagellar hook-basal body complex protein FliE